ncbi:Pkinase domain-containing protein [Cephalotus follicularis]|uniref:Serine/threonine-protein kinase PRP4 homolog n=1 Tax=Cephalotus follicularis TaxID=3775 RepID=A0A1Q3AU68_CEPFO|nr:Pkinase domain-containing protein [Cephalotus follicularis]
MASDTHQDSQTRKHRRSPSDDEAVKPLKRHKHRHRHHRHRHHRSKKHEEEEKNIEYEIDVAPSVVASVPYSNRPDDDLEEGEIFEEDGEIKTVEVDDENPEVVAKEGSSYHECSAQNENARAPKTLKEDIINNVLPGHSSIEPQIVVVSNVGLYNHVNGYLGHEYRTMEEDRPRESSSPLNRSGKQKSYHDVDIADANEIKSTDNRTSLSSESTGKRYTTLGRSPSRDRYCEEVYTRSRSSEHARERSRSRSIVEEESIWKRRRRHELDDSLDRRQGGRDLVWDEEKEHSASYGRYAGGEHIHHNRETRVMERSREKERESSRYRDSDRDRRREKEQESSRETEMNADRRREKERGRSSNRDMNVDRRREKDRDRVRDSDVDRDGNRGMERDRSRDRAWARERERDEVIEMEKGRDRVREREREKGRERRSGRSMDNFRDFESHREKYENHGDSYGDRDTYKYSGQSRDDGKGKSRKNDYAKHHTPNSDSVVEVGNRLKRDEDEDEDDFEERLALKLAEQEEEDLNKIKEESRKRRQAILEKYKNQNLQQQIEIRSDDVETVKEPSGYPAQPVRAANAVSDICDGVSDGPDVYVADPLLSVGKSPPQNGVAAFEKTSGAGALGEGTPKSERSDDMFCDDIFGESPAGVRKLGKGEGLQIVRSGLHDNWDDADGYYSYRFGELLDGRYEVTAAHGKGVFSTVVRAKDLKAGIDEPEEVAIKIIRNNETMHKAGQLEVQILKKLVGADPDDKRHCVRFLSSFKYRNHLCLVFESLHMNLREVLKKFGRNIGLKLTAVRAYAKQLFIALKHLKNCGVLHCDIKPDNMLVNEAKNVLKLCDFGNAMFAGKNEITPYLVSRFYRAPEIILGLPYDHPMDIWSVGCCLYELYTGKVLFPGPSNNDMLRLHMELKGPFPKKMLRKGGFTDQHFDQDLNFHATEEDPVTKKSIKRMIVNVKPKDIGSIVTSSPGEDPKMLANFKDFLEKIFVLDPDKRMTVSQALTHPFISGK